MYVCFKGESMLKAGMSCLIIAGICDLFDGVVARTCKRTESEKEFGVQLDSLVDVIDFIAFPICLFMNMKLTAWYQLLVIAVFAVCGIARLAYFNISLENNSEPVSYYSGLPVTYTAMILPLGYLLSYICTPELFKLIFTALIFMIALLQILNVNIKKPKGIAYLIFPVLAVAMLCLYLVIL